MTSNVHQVEVVLNHKVGFVQNNHLKIVVSFKMKWVKIRVKMNMGENMGENEWVKILFLYQR